MKTVLVTGANRGIGLAFAKSYAKQGFKVYGTARNVNDAKELAQYATVLPLDVSDPKSIDNLKASLKSESIDLLINNAAILTHNETLTVTAEQMVESFMINAVGPLLMIQALNLANGAKCVNITSRVGSIADNTSGGLVAYRTSKTALNMITKNLSIEMPSVTFIALHPGYIRTGMTRGNGDMDPEEAVERMNVVINSANKTGAFLHRDGHELPW